MNKIKTVTILIIAAITVSLIPFTFSSCANKDGKDEAKGSLLHSGQTPIIESAGSESDSAAASKADILYSPVNYDVVNGVWISYIELSGILTKKTEKQFRQSYSEMMDNCAGLGINTVFVHLRPFGDALYESEYYPWSKYASGKVGQSPGFDPLRIMIEETHKRDISFHGWINPMRIQHNDDIEKVSADYPIGEWYRDSSKKDKYITLHDGNWYLNPAYDEVVELIGNGAEEITKNYDVDGIHIDDYFYPTTANSFDADAFGKSTFSDLGKFRTFNCNNMVRTLYTSAKKGNPNTLFGISPSGNIRYSKEELYADVEAWCKNIGYTDYIAPQVYYGFENSEQPYSDCVNNWQEMLTNSPVKLLVGLAVYKIGSKDAWAGEGEDEWIEENQILLRQIQEAKGLQNYSGIIFFSYNWLFSPIHVTDAIQDEIDAFKPLLLPEQ